MRALPRHLNPKRRIAILYPTGERKNRVDSKDLQGYLKIIDEHLRDDAALVIYGSAACILLGETGRTSLDIDVAAPYSAVNFPDFEQAAGKAGLKINPDETCSDDHIEWISSIRLCLSEPDDSTSQVLWRGRRLTVRTVSPSELVASKLIRYDDIDGTDIRFLCGQARLSFDDIAKAALQLPPAFRDDPVLRENLAGLETDIELWRSTR